jgi:hypothetical protein
MFWCYHSYAANDHPTGPCDACGQPVQAPIRPLREAAQAGADIYLRAEALRSLIAIEGAAPLRPLLEELARDAPFNVRDIARGAPRNQQPGNGPDASVVDVPARDLQRERR